MQYLKPYSILKNPIFGSRFYLRREGCTLTLVNDHSNVFNLDQIRDEILLEEMLKMIKKANMSTEYFVLKMTKFCYGLCSSNQIVNLLAAFEKESLRIDIHCDLIEFEHLNDTRLFLEYVVDGLIRHFKRVNSPRQSTLTLSLKEEDKSFIQQYIKRTASSIPHCLEWLNSVILIK